MDLQGDAQFGMHGAMALGWMTLEGTKSAGTDFLFKNCKDIRLAATKLNCSRIYGNMPFCSSSKPMPEAAENLYAQRAATLTDRLIRDDPRASCPTSLMRLQIQISLGRLQWDAA